MAELGANQAARRAKASIPRTLEVCGLEGAKTVELSDPQHQQTSAWCGAATAKLLMEHHNALQGKSTDEQCVIISKVLRIDTTRHNCCEVYLDPPEDTIIPSENDIDSCIKGIWPHKAFLLYNFDYVKVSQALDWERLTQEICLGSPFIAVIRQLDQSNSGHTVVVKGYSFVKPASSLSSNDEYQDKYQWVEIYDPFATEFEFVSYSEFVGDPRNANGPYGYSHVVDYAGILPLPSE
jgi:hypothetical protein